MDELDLSEIENRWNKAFPLIQMGCFSKGCSVGYGFVVNDELASEYAPASQEFIDNAPMDISSLVLEVKRLRQDRAEVRRDALREGFRLGTENANDRVWGAFRDNLMTSSQINAIEKEVYRILKVIFADIEEQSDWYYDSLVEHKEQKAADQGQGQGKE